MRIIESQSAVLTNFEVYQHLVQQRESYRNQKKRRGPPNLETVVRELLQYLQTPPGPLSQQPITMKEESISQLLERLRPFELSKGEVIVILNLRPASIAALNTVIEDMADRFSDEQQEEMIAIIGDVLGFAEPAAVQGKEANGQDEEDVSMADASAS